MGPDVRVLRKRVEALAHDHERRRIVDFVENNLQDLICSGLGASGWCGATAATHRQDGPFALAGPLDVVSSLLVYGLTVGKGTESGNRVC